MTFCTVFRGIIIIMKAKHYMHFESKVELSRRLALCRENTAYGVWRCSSTHSEPGNRSRWVSCVTVGRFTLGTRCKGGWVKPRTDWNNEKKRTLLVLTENRTTVPRLSTPYPWHYTTHAVQAPDQRCSCTQRRQLWWVRYSSTLAWHGFRPTQVYERERVPGTQWRGV
jgi:hypothetical protein